MGNQCMARFLSAVPNGDLREVVRHFTPNWFAANMGTGILALMLADFPYHFPGQLVAARGLWSINVIFFCLFTVLFLGRAIFYPAAFHRLFEHPVQSLFIGAIPMGFATIVNGIFLLWPLSPETILIAHYLWWVDVALSLFSVLAVPYYMFTTQHHAMDRMTAAWLLPVVPPEVAAASGGMLAGHLSIGAAGWVIYTSYVLWAISVPLAFAILTILFLRLTLHKMPHIDMAVSAWLPLGPLGTGSLAMLVLGPSDQYAFANSSMSAVGALGEPIGIIAGLVLWGFGLWWMAIAIFFTLRYLNEGLPFNMGWWGFTFPLGVFTASTYALARETRFVVFDHIGAAFTILLAFFWVVVTWRTFGGMWVGRLFRDPSLSEETAMLIDSKEDVQRLITKEDVIKDLRS